jgi:hypothetical protein
VSGPSGTSVGRFVKSMGLAVVTVMTVSLLGGCMSVPAVSGPHAMQSPGTPQKAITQLLTQYVDLTEAAIAATGVTDGWMSGAIQEHKPWDPASEDLHLAPCSSVGSDDASQIDDSVAHLAFEHDPHPIADKLTAYWKSQGFTVERTVDWTSPSGTIGIAIRATRADGVYYGLTATNEQVAIRVSTECSTDSSIDDWAEARVQKRLDSLHPTPSAPAPSPTSTAAPLPSSAGMPDANGWFW